MSDDEFALASGSSTRVKMKKVDRSCDLCRKRKIRCDAAKDAGSNPIGSCSHCVQFGSPCTWDTPTKKRGPKNKQVEELKRHVAALEAKLRSVSICSLCSQPLRNDGSTPMRKTRAGEDGDDLAPELSRISVDSKFFGATSGFALANEAIAVKERYTGQQSTNARRPLYWNVLPWEQETYEQSSSMQFTYPEPDLLYNLLKLYFDCVHPTLPVLHRPSFERSVNEGLHHKDPQFGGMLLAVMAVASRFSDDPRVFIDGQELSSGWKFIRQVPVIRKWFEPNIYEVQMYFLMTLFSIGTSRPQAAWIYMGNGIRFLQQRGEQRRKRDMQDTDKEKETWSRVFWAFVILDRLVCAYIGRPTALHVEDYDADPLIQVDDEYWDTGFVQPPNKPAFSAFMFRYVQLCEILGEAMRKLYGSKRSKALQGSNGKEWEQRAVANLDSQMNKIFDSLPPHLHWDPDNQPRGAFYDQSFVLYMTYYYTQIVVHRPYIQKLSAIAAPSLSICASAARSILHAGHAWITRQQRLPMQFTISPVFVSSVILIMSTFGKRPGPSVDKDKALVKKGMDIIKYAEVRLHPQGRLWEMLNRLQSIDGPLSRPPRPKEPSPPLQAYSPTAVPVTATTPPSSQSHSQTSSPQYAAAQVEYNARPAGVSSEMYPPPPPEGDVVESVTPPHQHRQRWHNGQGPSASDLHSHPHQQHHGHAHMSNGYHNPPTPYVSNQAQAYDPTIGSPYDAQAYGNYMGSPNNFMPGTSIDDLLMQTQPRPGYHGHVQQQQQQQLHSHSPMSPYEQQLYGNEYMQQMHASYVQDDDMHIDDSMYTLWQAVPDNISDVQQWGMYMARASGGSPPGYGQARPHAR
ncbi:Fungal-trans domain-containing protein [Mycena kentingensis (nom. inval.)]|nr:Fungal-trans domain-containing protein [Mycena kentingensis (nom. inval.)]